MLSGATQQSLQEMIDNANIEEQQKMKLNAERFLGQLNIMMDQRLLSGDEMRRGEIAIEILVRLESTQNRKGWFFRAKRRVQLVRCHLSA